MSEAYLGFHLSADSWQIKHFAQISKASLELSRHLKFNRSNVRGARHDKSQRAQIISSIARETNLPGRSSSGVEECRTPTLLQCIVAMLLFGYVRIRKSWGSQGPVSDWLTYAQSEFMTMPINQPVSIERYTLKHGRDLLILSIIIVASMLLLVVLGVGNYLLDAIVLLGVPSCYISARDSTVVKKSLGYAAAFSLPVTLIFDYIAHVSRIWYETSVLGLRVLGAFPVDAFFWFFLYCYLITVFYKYFFDQGRSKHFFERRMKSLGYFMGWLVLSFGIVVAIDASAFSVPDFYLILLLMLLAISLVVLSSHLGIIAKIAFQTVYFGIYSFAFELIALSHRDWNFPGNSYVGWLHLGKFAFPLEEFLWFWLAVPALICIYEYFDDDLS